MTSVNHEGEQNLLFFYQGNNKRAGPKTWLTREFYDCIMYYCLDSGLNVYVWICPFIKFFSFFTFFSFFGGEGLEINLMKSKIMTFFSKAKDCYAYIKEKMAIPA